VLIYQSKTGTTAVAACSESKVAIQSTRENTRNAYQILVEKPEGKKLTSLHDRMILKRILNEIIREGVDWIQLPQDRVQWLALVNTVKGVAFIDQLSDYQLLKKGSAPRN
jgi:hypothetical protein